MRELNDRYQNPMAGGYRDIQLVVQFQNHMCELQLNTEEMLRAKSTTGHRGFEVLRELAAATKENDLDRVKGALQFGLEHLGSRWGDASSSKTALEELLQLEESREIVVEACRRGSAGIVAQLLFSGADANAVSPASGDTALHEAVFHGHQGCVWAVSRASLGRHSFDILTRFLLALFFSLSLRWCNTAAKRWQSRHKYQEQGWTDTAGERVHASL